MAIDLRGKPIAITGASSGIGAATAIECARAGMPVALGARRADKLAEVVARIESAGGRAIAVPMDVCRDDDNARLVAETVRAFGSIYAAFANAGYGAEAAVSDMSDADVRAMFECNVFGSLSLLRAALPEVRKNPGPDRGHLLMCSSCLAKMSVPYSGVYSATKAAQNLVGRAMNLELEPEGVHVSTVHPVGTRTEFFDQMKKKNGGPIVEHAPDLFMQSPERVARAVVKSLRRPRPEVWTSLPTRLGMAVCVAFPGAEDWYLRRMVRKKARLRGTGSPQDQSRSS